jgi:hypothetical protein
VHHDPIKTLQPAVVEECSERGRPPPQLSIADALFAGEERNAIVMSFEQLAEDLVQGLVLPVAPAAIPLRELRRKWNNSVESHQVVAE